MQHTEYKNKKSDKNRAPPLLNTLVHGVERAGEFDKLYVSCRMHAILVIFILVYLCCVCGIGERSGCVVPFVPHFC